MTPRMLPLLIALALAPALAHAAAPRAPAAPEATRQAEIEKAQAELEAAARRVAELSGSTELQRRQVMVQRMGPGMQRPGVGIVMSPADSGPGVRIAAVTPDGPAAKAGLRAGDVLLRVDGKPLAGTGDAALESAREQLGGLALDQSVRLDYSRDGKPGAATVKVGNIQRVLMFSSARAPEVGGSSFHFEPSVPGLGDDMQIEIRQLGSAPCAPGSRDCALPTLTQAFRWNGLNLASMDAKLGRYFGTDTGVLVISGGPGMTDLEPGDVIQKIEGEAVATPRDAMRALRSKEAGGKVRVQVLRERKPRTLDITLPDEPPMHWFAPPAPPALPAAAAPPAPAPAPAPAPGAAISI